MHENKTELSKIDKPFGLLDKETQKALKNSHERGLEIEIYLEGEWRFSVNPLWSLHITYRAKPTPPTKPSIDWTHVAPLYRFLARDGDGRTYLHARFPIYSGFRWSPERGLAINATAFASLRPGTCAPEDSLVVRPDGV